MSERAPDTRVKLDPQIDQQLATVEAAQLVLDQQRADGMREKSESEIRSAWNGEPVLTPAEQDEVQAEVDAERASLMSFQEYLDARPTRDRKSTDEYAQLDFLKPTERNKRSDNEWAQKPVDQLVGEYSKALFKDDETLKKDVIAEFNTRILKVKSKEKQTELINTLEERLTAIRTRYDERKARIADAKDLVDDALEGPTVDADKSEPEPVVVEPVAPEAAPEAVEPEAPVAAPEPAARPGVADRLAAGRAAQRAEQEAEKADVPEPVEPEAEPTDGGESEPTADEAVEDAVEDEPVAEDAEADEDAALEDEEADEDAADDEEEYDEDVDPTPVSDEGKPGFGKKAAGLGKKFGKGILNTRFMAKGTMGRRMRIATQDKKRAMEVAEIERKGGAAGPVVKPAEKKEPGRVKQFIENNQDRDKRWRKNLKDGLNKTTESVAEVRRNRSAKKAAAAAAGPADRPVRTTFRKDGPISAAKEATRRKVSRDDERRRANAREARLRLESDYLAAQRNEPTLTVEEWSNRLRQAAGQGPVPVDQQVFEPTHEGFLAQQDARREEAARASR